MTLKRENDKIIIEIPVWQYAHDYFDKVVGQIPAIEGVICGDEQGLIQMIDMTYADKAPQHGDFIVRTSFSEEDFKKLCKDLGIGFYKYPVCDYCFKPIFGAFTLGDRGKQCGSCGHKK